MKKKNAANLFEAWIFIVHTKSAFFHLHILVISKVSYNKVLIEMKIRSSWVSSLLQPLWSMPDKAAKAKVVLSKVGDHLHLLQALGPTLPAQAGPIAVEDGEELSDVKVVVFGLKVPQKLCLACLTDSTGGTLRWSLLGGSRSLGGELLKWRSSLL